ncbi:hypothetical protein BHE74_00013506 [Ensete ventricosum]|nr:hypothetical protein BHE74_00013506 [Ensete ventricosum]
MPDGCEREERVQKSAPAIAARDRTWWCLAILLGVDYRRVQCQRQRSRERSNKFLGVNCRRAQCRRQRSSRILRGHRGRRAMLRYGEAANSGEGEIVSDCRLSQ